MKSQPSFDATFPAPLGGTLFRYLAIAARSKAPFAEVLQSLAKDPQTFGKHAKRLLQLGDQPQTRLSDTLASQPGLFAPATTALIAEAEEADKLTLVLETLGSDYQARQRGWAQVRSAMAWPVTLTVVLMFFAVVVLSFVVPAYQEVFWSFDLNLPWATRWLILVSGVVAPIWWLIALVAVVLLVAVRRNRVPAPLADFLWQVCARIPGCKNYFVRQYGARLALWVGAVGHDAALLQAALLHLQQSTAVPVVRQSAAGLGERLKGGEALTDALAHTPHVPQSLMHATRFALAPEDKVLALALCHELTQDQATLAGEMLGRWMFFVSYVAVGVLTGLFLLAVYLPIFKLGELV